MWSRVELKEDSKSLLKLNYLPFVLVAFIHSLVADAGRGTRASVNLIDGLDDWYGDGYYYNFDRFMREVREFVLPFLGMAIITVSIAWIVMFVLRVFVFDPLEVGCKRYMTMARNVKPEYGEIIFAFKNCYANVVKTMFLRAIFTALWTLLFIIPGIVKSYEYRMVPYLMAEYPDMASSEAFRISREMMSGNKWEAFVLDLSFLGWNILSTITFGLVGVFFVRPYFMLTDAALYLTLKKTNPAFGYVQPDDNYYFQK